MVDICFKIAVRMWRGSQKIYIPKFFQGLAVEVVEDFLRDIWLKYVLKSLWRMWRLWRGSRKIYMPKIFQGLTVDVVEAVEDFLRDIWMKYVLNSCGGCGGCGGVLRKYTCPTYFKAWLWMLLRLWRLWRSS